MKLAVPSKGPDPEYEMDDNFGRAYWFLIFDEKIQKWEALDNGQTRSSPHSAGVLATRMLSEHGVDAVLTGEMGPKAFRTLTAAGIEVFYGGPGTVDSVVKSWRKGLFQKGSAANSIGSPQCLVGQAASTKHEPKVNGVPWVKVNPV